MNTLQLISYFQFLSLYYTILLAKFLQSLDVSSLKIRIAFIDDMIDDIKDGLLRNNDYNLGNNDEKIQENGIDSSSILRNASGILTILFQGCCCCLVMYALKAKFVTLKEKQKERHEPMVSHTLSSTETVKNLMSSKSAESESRFNLWVQKKIIR
jgi:hypothetical protein